MDGRTDRQADRQTDNSDSIGSSEGPGSKMFPIH